MYVVWANAGLSPAWFHSVSLLLHIASTLLVYLSVSVWHPMQRGAFWAAAFFAIYEGHQEAVMWFSAINELLLFVFGIGALLCWLLATRSRWWHVPGVVLFALALVSKESAFIFLPLFLLVRMRFTWDLLLYVGTALPAILTIVQARASSFRFIDGSFSLSAPFWVTLPKSTLRLLWIWGMLALIYWIAKKLRMESLWGALAWIVISFLPYSFLTYSTAIPSRQTYLASAGLAMLVGLALAHFAKATDPRIVATVLAVVVAQNVGTIWTKKRSQFLDRAAPTERLLRELRTTTGPFDVRCFPRPRTVAEEAVELAEPDAAPRLIWHEPDTSCR